MRPSRPVVLPSELEAKIRRLAKEWNVQVNVPQGATKLPADTDPGAFASDVFIRSRYRPSTIEGLVCNKPDPRRSPWAEYWEPKYEDPWDFEGMQEKQAQDKQKRDESYPTRLKDRSALPIAGVKDKILHGVHSKRVTLIAAETGSGKSTQVPQYILDEAVEQGNGPFCHVIVTQPRRLAACSLADRVRWERGDDKSVGHVVRWDERPPRPWGSICFCTVGALLPRLEQMRASHIIVDEAHTRDVHTDLLLTVLPILLRDSPHLKVLVMSATFDVDRLYHHFGGGEHVSVVESTGRPHNVKEYLLDDIIQEIQWQPAPSSSPKGREARQLTGAWDEVDCNKKYEPRPGINESTASVIRNMSEYCIHLDLIIATLRWVAEGNREGGVLVFLPGWQEITACADAVRGDRSLTTYEIFCLHSSVPPAEQQRALNPPRRGKRKVILSTDIAETSITVPDVLCIVDTGLARVRMHSTLEVQWASQANLIQRRGRAGRVQDGICVHLITKQRFDRLPREPVPEMRRVTLEDVVLSVCDLGLDWEGSRRDYESQGRAYGVVKFLQGAPDPPEEKMVKNAFTELQFVGALDRQGYVTHLGALLARLPLAPTLGGGFLLGGILGIPETVCYAMAGMGSREPWSRSHEGVSPALPFSLGFDGKEMCSDVFAMATALRQFEEANSQEWCKKSFMLYHVLTQMWNANRQLQGNLRDAGCCPTKSKEENSAEPHEDLDRHAPSKFERDWPLMQAVLTYAFSWNLGMAEGGRKVRAGWKKPPRLNRNSVLAGSDPKRTLITYSEITGGSGGRIISSATAITECHALLFGGREKPVWQAKSRSCLLDKWLVIPAALSSAAALAALRSTTRLILDHVAQRIMEHRINNKGQKIWDQMHELFTTEDDTWLTEWRDCVRAVAELPPPGRAEPWEWTHDDEEPPSYALQNRQESTLDAGTRTYFPPAPKPHELPIGWRTYVGQDGTTYYATTLAATGEIKKIRFDQPAKYGPDGHAAVWRWQWSREVSEIPPSKEYVLINAPSQNPHQQTTPPKVGDGYVLPWGWDSKWDIEQQCHYFWKSTARDEPSFEFPLVPCPFD